MENFEKNIERGINPEAKEIQEVDFELEEKKTVSKNERQQQLTPSGSIKTKEEKSGKESKISPILSKKMQYFLDIAEEKGLAAAIKAVENENDPLLLDSFHDALAKEKLFENLLKKRNK
jgi:hypothetical protein